MEASAKGSEANRQNLKNIGAKWCFEATLRLQNNFKSNTSMPKMREQILWVRFVPSSGQDLYIYILLPI